MYPTQIGRSVCQCICRSGCTWWNEMDVQLFFEGTATHLIIETPVLATSFESRQYRRNYHSRVENLRVLKLKEEGFDLATEHYPTKAL